MSGVRRRGGGSCRRFPNLLEDSSEDEEYGENIELAVLDGSDQAKRRRPDSGYYSLVTDKRIPSIPPQNREKSNVQKSTQQSSSEEDEDAIGPTVATWYKRMTSSSDPNMTSVEDEDQEWDFDTYTNVRWRDFFRKQKFNQPNELLDRDLFSSNFEDILESSAFRRRLSDFEQYVEEQRVQGGGAGFTDSAEFWDNGNGLTSSNHIYNCAECRPRPPCLCADCKYTCHHRCRQQVRLDCEPGPPSSDAVARVSDTLPSNNNHHYTPLPTIPIANGRPDDGLASIATIANGDLARDYDHDSSVHLQRHQRRHSATASSPIQEAPPSPPPPRTPSTAPQTPVVPPVEAPSDPPVQMITTAVGASHTINGSVVSASEVSTVVSPYATAPLRQRLDLFNKRQKKPDTLHLTDAETFQGFIRVTLNLSRPINMSVGARPPSIYDLLAHQEGAPPQQADMPQRLETMSFYIPKDTIKSLHISSKTTAGEVIAELLHKFNITDSPRKFALYEQYREPETKLLRVRKVGEKEKPLELLLAWQEVGESDRKFLLQENETGDIMWEAFSIPELHNFLRILAREEEEHVAQIRTKYKLLKLQLNVKMRDSVEIEHAVQGKLEFTTSRDQIESRTASTTSAAGESYA